jgi:hypothetical protein
MELLLGVMEVTVVTYITMRAMLNAKEVEVEVARPAHQTRSL